MTDKLQELYTSLDLSGSKLAHFGVKGMRWGVRKDIVGLSIVGSRTPSLIGVKGNGPAPTKQDRSQNDRATMSAHKSFGSKQTLSEINYFNKKMKETIGDKWLPEQQKLYDNHVAKIIENSANRALVKPMAAHVMWDSNHRMLLAVGHKTAVSDWKKTFGNVKHAMEDSGVTTSILIPIRDQQGFIIGVEVMDDSLVQSSMTEVDEFLSHFGVKGMRWGVRKDNSGSGRPSGSTKKSSSSTKTSALHNTSLKSKGFRLLKRAMGDKTYWKREALILGIGLPASIATAIAAPMLFPAAAIAYAGSTYAASTMIGTAGMQTVRIAGMINYINYWRRSSPKRKATQLAHADDSQTTVQDIYNKMSALKKDALSVLIAAHMDEIDVSDDAELLEVWNSMTDEEKATSYFITSVVEGSEASPGELAQSSMTEVEEFLSHFGVKGMRWGVRRSDRQLARAHASNATESVDSVRAKETLATIKKHGTLSAVSDADLNHLINRLNIEKRYADVNPAGFDKQHSRVKKLLAVGVTMNEVYKFATSPAGQIVAAKFGIKTKSLPGKHMLGGGKKKKKK